MTAGNLRIEPGKSAGFWVLFLNEDAGVQAYLPQEFQSTGNFSLFWRAYVELGQLHSFVNACARPNTHHCALTYAHARYDIDLPVHRSGNQSDLLPTRLEDEVLKAFGLPATVRYDIFDLQTRRLRDESADLIVWSTLADGDEFVSYKSTDTLDQPIRKETGVYTSLASIKKLNMKKPLSDLLSATLVPKRLSQSSDQIVSELIAFIDKETPSGLAEDPAPPYIP